jgi:hypothetical protein
MTSWSKCSPGIETTVVGYYQLFIGGKRGHWDFTIHQDGKKDPVAKGWAMWKDHAKTEAWLAVQRLIEKDQERQTEREHAPISYKQLAEALEKARARARSDALSCGYNGSELATFDGAARIVDSFIASLIHALAPEE